MARRRIVFLTRPGCGLCDAALPLVQRASRWLRRDVVVRDLTTAPQLEAEYHMRIPVVLDGNGRVLAEGRVTATAAFLAVLRA